MKIILQAEDGTEKSFLLEDKNLIGRSKKSTVCLSGDDLVSRKHAAIIKKGNSYWLTDLGSNNGTYVNAELLSTHVRLHDKDTITIGNYTFTVQSNKADRTAFDQDDEETVFGHPSQFIQQSDEPLNEETQFMSPQTFQELYKKSGVELHILNGSRQGETLLLHNTQTIIGRDSGCDLCLDCTSVSKQHARIRSDHHNFILEDLGSKNATFVNKARLVGEVQLHAGDIIQIGDVSLRFGNEPVKQGEFKPQPDAPPNKKKKAWFFLALLLAGGSIFFLLRPSNISKTQQDTVIPEVKEVIPVEVPKKNATSPAIDVQKQAKSIISDSIQMYIDGDIEKALQHLEKIVTLNLDNDNSVRLQGEQVGQKIKECYQLYRDGHQSFIRGEIDASVKKWDRVLSCEAAFIDHSSQKKSELSKNISRIMAEELYMQAMKLVKEKNLIMAKQYCIEVLKAIPQHQGCLEILKVSEKQ